MASANSPQSKRVLLCEGAAGSIVPDVCYVQQGEKVYFFRGGKALCESWENDKTIVESLDQLELVEVRQGDRVVKTVKDGKFVVEGVYQRSDVLNGNKRIYPRKVWERIVADKDSKAQKMIKERAMGGHIEHPKDGRSDLKNFAMLHTHLELKENGEVYGKSELLNTADGLHLQTLTLDGVKWGVSSRGNGSVSDKGVVSESDFDLETFDAVARPSTPGAHPSRVESDEDKKLAESEELSDDSVSTLMESCETLITTNVDEMLDTSDRTAYLQSLLDKFGEVNRKLASKALPLAAGTDVQKRMIEKLKQTTETVTEAMESAIDQVITESVDGERVPDGDRTRRQLRSLRERLARARSRAVRLESHLSRARESLREVRQQRDESVSRLERSVRSLRETRGMLTLAQEAIAFESVREPADDVTEAVSLAIDVIPALADYRGVLLEAESAEEVRELMRNRIAEKTGSLEPVSSIVPNRLPAGRLLESADFGNKNRNAVSTDPRAQTAAKVVRAVTARM